MPTDTPDAEVKPVNDIDRIVDEPARLRKLEGAGYVSVEKTFVDRLPLTVFRLTGEGREAIEAYRKQMLTCSMAFGG